MGKRYRFDVYVASSWKNPHYEGVLAALRARGLNVYDFRNDETAFNWREVHDAPFPWTNEQIASVLQHRLTLRGFAGDFEAMRASRVGVLVLPCGRSAHMEAGWMAGAGRPIYVYAPESGEPDTAHLLARGFATDLRNLATAVAAEVVAYPA